MFNAIHSRAGRGISPPTTSPLAHKPSHINPAHALGAPSHRVRRHQTKPYYHWLRLMNTGGFSSALPCPALPGSQARILLHSLQPCNKCPPQIELAMGTCAPRPTANNPRGSVRTFLPLVYASPLPSQPIVTFKCLLAIEPWHQRRGQKQRPKRSISSSGGGGSAILSPAAAGLPAGGQAGRPQPLSSYSSALGQNLHHCGFAQNFHHLRRLLRSKANQAAPSSDGGS